jgi:hypothetical protein
MRTQIIILLLLISSATSVHAELYKCLQQTGRLGYQDKPCPTNSKTVFADQTPHRQMSPTELEEHKAAVDALARERSKRRLIEEQKLLQAKKDQEKVEQDEKLRKLVREEAIRNQPAPIYYPPPPPRPINCYNQGGNVYCN